MKWFFKWVRNKNGLKIFTLNNSNNLIINCRFWKSRIWKFIVNQKNFINSLQGNFMYSIGIQHYRQKLPQYINKTWDEVFPTFMSQFNSSKRGSTWSAKAAGSNNLHSIFCYISSLFGSLRKTEPSAKSRHFLERYFHPFNKSLKHLNI